VNAARAGTLFELAIGVLAVAGGVLLGVPILDLLRPTAAAIAGGVLAAVPLALALFALFRAPLPAIRRIEHELDRVVRPLFHDAALPELVALSAAAGIGEELFFRGLIQGAAARAFGPVGGVAVAALFFGVAHAVTRTYAALAAAVGAYFGALALATGNLLVPVLAHAAYDLAALIYWLRIRAPGAPHAVGATDAADRDGAPE
jgi:membrane protease YdiL (CAAX protease family)